MIVPDINLLVYAYNSDAPYHRSARSWWEDCLSEPRPLGLPWAVMLGYLRIMTNRGVLEEPLAPADAIGHIRSWLERPQVQIMVPGPRHLDLLMSLSAAAKAAGNLTTDLHLAALAIENQAELHSNDADFARFPGLRWFNPLE
ncbi:MAG: type II toxin-antitoxin system VapC family toxin [Acidobacteriota bacterium]